MGILLGFSGIGSCAATFLVDDASFDIIKGNLDGAKGMAVALKANDTVGFGVESGSPLFGVIEKVDSRGLASVVFAGFVEDVSIGALKPILGEMGLGVDGLGKIVKLASAKRGTITAISSTSATLLL